jgi:hypothetical protein
MQNRGLHQKTENSEIDKRANDLNAELARVKQHSADLVAALTQRG